MIKHTDECLKNQSIAARDYAAKFPKYCNYCDATGYAIVAPSVAGVDPATGRIIDGPKPRIICGNCVAQNKCPRCASDYTLSSVRPCTNCGYIGGVTPGAPAVNCNCPDVYTPTKIAAIVKPTAAQKRKVAARANS